MSMTKTQIDPRQHDEATAALYFSLDQYRVTRSRQHARIIHSAGVVATRYGKDTKRGWGSEEEYFSFSEAVAILSKREDRDSAILLAEHELTTALIEATEEAIEQAESEYTGWSRFFLVTSSQGHIHSSMHCHTCYPTTAYGWLPELSGKTKGEAVDELGPALCSSCFPGAGTQSDQWTRDKISESQARKLAWSPDRDEKAAKAAAEKAAKAEAKIKKAARALKTAENMAHKVNKLVDMFGNDIDAEYRWTWDNKGYDNAHYVHSDMVRRAR